MRFWQKLPKLRVAGSNPVSRSNFNERLRLVRAGAVSVSCMGGPDWAGCGPGDSAGLDEPQKAHVFLLWAHPMRVAPQRCLRARMSERVLKPHDRLPRVESPRGERMPAAVERQLKISIWPSML